ncbi:magnesium-translocating P-type ATPase [Devosia sp. A16]|uniref:magnesium-translocating P-type ATPase n=1 Tax=Devosia sp. A16 TaxID=1736675 RepID=UPI0009E68361|nr:magnesium-translocating P-type ATPase [Devosia sp. A16]
MLPAVSGQAPPVRTAPFWTRPVAELLAELQAGPDGLTTAEAERRLGVDGPNADTAGRRPGLTRAVARRLLEPLSLILLGAGVVSAATGDLVGGSIIVAILAVSIGLDTVQEGHAGRAAEELRRSVALQAEVKRGGVFVGVPVEDVVRGDIIRVRAGDIVPADAIILEASGFSANQAALTGEAFPAEKRPGAVNATTASEATNAVFRGAVAQTGEATALVVGTGRNTVFGAAAMVLTQETELSPFQRDLRAFGLLIARLTIALVLVVLATHVLFGRPVLQSLLFAVALAVGLTPELLPMITTVTLSRGALRLAQRKVIVKRLASIHDLGAMTILCTDKTGTLTSAEIALAGSLDGNGADDHRAARLGAIAAELGGDRAALDLALVAGTPEAASGWSLKRRLSFDFGHRLGSVLVDGPEGELLIVKGAAEAVIENCIKLRTTSGTVPIGGAERAAALALVRQKAADGLRLIAVGSRAWQGEDHELSLGDETGLVLEGFCAFTDPPRATAKGAVRRLATAGVRIKILSGDDPVAVARLAALVGLRSERVLSGADIAALSDAALAVQVQQVDVYGRLAPDQKSRLVHALRARGDIVGYLGDGINDAPALKTADIGLSVSGATGVAQAAADMILLDSDLEVVANGVEEGRRTFANILKYVRMGASSNFGNMLSMAGASLLLPFLPMLPTQILLNNLLYDISEIGIPFDTVRRQAVARPQRWDMKRLLRFALVMGSLSSMFDALTFAGLIVLFHVDPEAFRTAWFLESMATQILVIFVIRTNGRPWADRPHRWLVLSSLAALAVAMILPFTPMASWLAFEAPPPAVLASLAGVVAAYLVAAEYLKRRLVNAIFAPATRRTVRRDRAKHR